MAVKTTTQQKSIPVAVLVVALVVILGGGFFLYLDRAANRPPPPPPPLTAEAKAYVHNLQLMDVDMQKHESYMKQAVVEITGKIGNNGNRSLRVVEINCVFYDPYGQLVLRERVPIVSQKIGRPGARRDQEFPSGLRQYSGKLEPSLAATGDCANHFRLTLDSMPSPAAIGFRAHSGWAAAVAV